MPKYTPVNSSYREVTKAYNYSLHLADEFDNHEWSRALPERDWKFIRAHLKEIRELSEYLFKISHEKEEE